ncbi:G protein-activated inward rectifier potassium channel 2-like isoform X2 [Protopterus annectens]|uniref:G protein-activated inward rectifier potassium channel 2-like isoform X2 n=1 Tax=Protopterus annectens TaxID=7888 RepID=UPI001CFAAD83|nr:G protein-activated inward rectifier potassium channel 2-like isoform X2 [Protopterus annectens]
MQNLLLTVRFMELPVMHQPYRRIVKKNGQCDLRYIGETGRRSRFWKDPFNTFLDAPWPLHLLILVSIVVGICLFFAVMWWLIAVYHGDTNLTNNENCNLSCIEECNLTCVGCVHSFSSAFLFSLETQTTIGYGLRVVHDHCTAGIILLLIQSIMGMITHSVLVGCIYAKISRPEKRARTIQFSKYAIIALREGQLCLMYRIGDICCSNGIVGSNVTAKYIKRSTTEEGEIILLHQTKFPVQVDSAGKTPFLTSPLAILVYHTIDEKSPLYNVSREDLSREEFEIVVILEGTFETTGQPFQARRSYLPSEIYWGYNFLPIISLSSSGYGYEIDFSRPFLLPFEEKKVGKKKK